MAIKQTQELERLMQEACDKDASEIFFIANEPACFRIHGAIQRTEGNIFSAEQIKTIAVAAFGEENLGSLGTENAKLTTPCQLEGVIAGRMCVSKAGGNLSIIVCFQPKYLPDIERLKIPKEMVQAAMAPNGLVLFSGPTGCGKTTSMFSVLDFINASKPCHICTCEYYITYYLTPKNALIQQREVGVDAPDMVSAISAAIFQHPDVLMIGELRSPEEIQTCLTAALAGHLVITQLHADSVEGAIQRLVDIFADEDMPRFRRHLAQILNAVCAQRLLSRADGKGRVAVYGILIPDNEMRNAIAEGRDIYERQTPMPDGCQTMAENVEKLCQSGIISKDICEKALAEINAVH